MAIYFRESNWMTVRRCADADGVAVVPLGSLEQHGPHLPCGTDSYQVTEIMRRAASRIDESLPVCICPTIDYSIVQWASPLASAGIAPFTFEQTLVDLCHALTDQGFRKIVLVHGHGGISAGRSALWQAIYEKRAALYVDFHPYDRSTDKIAEICGGPPSHGGQSETSMMLAIRPDLVDMDKAIDCPRDLWPPDFAYPSITGPGAYTIATCETTPDGHSGQDPRQATAEKGNKILDIIATAVVEAVSELASKPTPEQFRRMWRRSSPGSD
jgi:creatinine amidohydrolase